MTHGELVSKAMAWLVGKQRCSVAVSEFVSSGMETPDAIGWYGWHTILVEAKISMSDFIADKKKAFRIYPKNGMGAKRYFIVPEELVEKVLQILPDKWGLLYPKGRSIIIVKYSENFADRNQTQEAGILLSIIRRMSDMNRPIQGLGVKWYQPLHHYDHVPRAELYVDPETDSQATGGSTTFNDVKG